MQALKAMDRGRRLRWVRRGLTIATAGLLLGAVGLLGYPFFTNFYADWRQSALRHQLASSRTVNDYRHHAIPIGDSLVRLRIPKIGVDVVVVQGTTLAALRAGAGHYVNTPLPCEPGNVAIAGHRTTYGKPFNQIDRLRPGDAIIFNTPIGTCTYQVAADPVVVSPTDWSVVAPPPDPGARWLTLTSCHPEYSASHRIVVRATEVSASPTTA